MSAIDFVSDGQPDHRYPHDLWPAGAEGELNQCSVCRCTEVEIPTHCPGAMVLPEFRDQIAAGKLDFVNGHWVVRPGDWGKVSLP